VALLLYECTQAGLTERGPHAGDSQSTSCLQPLGDAVRALRVRDNGRGTIGTTATAGATRGSRLTKDKGALVGAVPGSRGCEDGGASHRADSVRAPTDAGQPAGEGFQTITI